MVIVFFVWGDFEPTLVIFNGICKFRKKKYSPAVKLIFLNQFSQNKKWNLTSKWSLQKIKSSSFVRLPEQQAGHHSVRRHGGPRASPAIGPQQDHLPLQLDHEELVGRLNKHRKSRFLTWTFFGTIFLNLKDESSVTRWLDRFLHLAVKNLPNAIQNLPKSPQIGNKPSKNCPRLWKFRQIWSHWMKRTVCLPKFTECYITVMYLTVIYRNVCYRCNGSKTQINPNKINSWILHWLVFSSEILHTLN